MMRIFRLRRGAPRHLRRAERSSVRRLTLVTVLAGLLTMAIGGVAIASFTSQGAGTGGARIASGRLRSLTMTPTSPNVVAGEAQSYTVSAVDDFDGSSDVSSSTDLSLTITNGTCSANSCTSSDIGTQVVTANYKGQQVTVNQTVTAAAAANLVFINQPAGSTVAGVADANTITVQIQDQYGNPVAQSGDPISLSVNNGAINSGETQNTDANGVASFSSVIVDLAHSGDTLSATGAGVSSASPSDPFTIKSAAADATSFSLEPTGSVTGSAIGAPTVTVSDAFGNPVSGDTVTIAEASGDGPLSGTLTGTTATNGTVEFNNIVINDIGSYTLTATEDESNTSTTSAPAFDVVATG